VTVRTSPAFGIGAAASAGLIALAALALGGCARDDGGSGAARQAVVVYAASSLGDAFEEIAGEFMRANAGVEVRLNLGGSAALAEQLVQGAPGDVFAAANEETMAAVVDAGLVPDEAVVFASNTLELAVPPGNPGGVSGLADLARPELAIALCAPEVPCGAASGILLDRAGVVAQPDTLEQDVRAALTKVQLGEVDAALVYRTDVRQAGAAVEGIEVAGAADVVNRYPIAVLRDAGGPDAARAFVEFVRSARGMAILEEAGFAPA